MINKKNLFKKLFIITDPEAGWDCVRGSFIAESEEDIEKYLGDQFAEDSDIIHKICSVDEISPILDELLKQTFEAGINHGQEAAAKHSLTYASFEDYLKRSQH